MPFWRSTRQELAPPPAAAPPSTRALEMVVAGLFDYAGMFPPANLELDAAIWESARSPRLARPHLVGSDLVVSLDDLARLDEERLRMAGFGDTEARLAVVGVPAEALASAIEAVHAKNAHLAGVMRVASLEIHGTTFPGNGLRDAVAALPGTQLFIEPRMPEAAWARNAEGVFRLLDRLEANDAVVGLKLRGSGATAVGPMTLGLLIPQIVELGIPFKATAGLHHPVVEAQHGNTVGFVGLAAAVRLRQALGEGFGAADVTDCVGETQAAAFAFDGELSWRGHAVTLQALGEALRTQAFAIGSCSLKEPDDDLVRLFGAPT